MKTRTTDFNYVRKEKSDFMLSVTVHGWHYSRWLTYLFLELLFRRGPSFTVLQSDEQDTLQNETRVRCDVECKLKTTKTSRDTFHEMAPCSTPQAVKSQSQVR